MAKILILSVVIAMLALPIVAARDPNIQRGLRKVLLFTIMFNLLYLVAVRFLYPYLQ